MQNGLGNHKQNKAEFGNSFNIRPANLFSKWRLKKFRWETNFQIVFCVETNLNIRKEKYTKKLFPTTTIVVLVYQQVVLSVDHNFWNLIRFSTI